MVYFFLILIWLAVVIWAPFWLKLIAWILAAWEVSARIKGAILIRRARKLAEAKLRFAQEATAPGAGIDRSK